MNPAGPVVHTDPRSVLYVAPASPRRLKSSRERVLDAATAVFAARGYRGASTQRIAERAGVNPATVFRIFTSKRKLYLEVLARKLSAGAVPWLLGGLKATSDPEEALRQVAERLEHFFDPVLIRLLLAGGLEQPRDLKKYLRPRLQTFYSLAGEYLQEQVDRGVLRELDPASMAQALVGMIFYQCILNELFGGQQLVGPVFERTGPTFADIWLHGVLKQKGSSEK